MDEPEDSDSSRVVDPPERSLKTVAILANAITCLVAFLAIFACVLLYLKIERDNATRNCMRRIDLFVQDLRDDVNLIGWDVLVARAEGDTSQDVRNIATDMRKNITTIRDTRQLRHDALSICEANPDFEY